MIFMKNNEKVHPEEMEYKLRFDGCSKSNPGMAGAGAVIYKDNEEIRCATSFVGKNATNNAAEYHGLIIGMQQALNIQIKSIAVEGDSLLVINQMKGIYKVKSLSLLTLYNEAKRLEKMFTCVTYNHIYRENNRRADELSNLALNQEEDESLFLISNH